MDLCKEDFRTGVLCEHLLDQTFWTSRPHMFWDSARERQSIIFLFSFITLYRLFQSFGSSMLRFHTLPPEIQRSEACLIASLDLNQEQIVTFCAPGSTCSLNRSSKFKITLFQLAVFFVTSHPWYYLTWVNLGKSCSFIGEKLNFD